MGKIEGEREVQQAFCCCVREKICTTVAAAAQFGVYAVYVCASESFNDWGGPGCRNFFHFLRDGTKIAPPGDITDQPSSGMSWIWGKFADHVEDHVVLSPEGTVLVTSPGTASSYPRPPNR